MKNRVFLISLFCFLLAAVCPQAQAQDIEPLLEVFNKRADAKSANRFFNALRQIGFTDEDIVFGPDAPKDSLRQQVWLWAADWFYHQHAYNSAEKYALKALPLYHPSNDSRADCLNLLSITYIRRGDFQRATTYAKQCVDIDIKSGNHNSISSSLNTLAGIYLAASQPKEAEQYITQAISHVERVNNPTRQAVIFGMASEIYNALGDYKRALSYSEKAFQTDSLQGRTVEAAVRLSQKCAALLGLKRYEEAEHTLRRILPQLRAANKKSSVGITLNQLGQVLLEQGRHSDAVPHFREAAAHFASLGDIHNEARSHQGLYESYWTLNPDSAKFHLKRFEQLKDTLYTHATADALARYNAEFGNDRMREENASIRRAHQLTIAGGAIALALILLGVWFLVRRIQARHRRHTLELVHEIERLRQGHRWRMQPEADETAIPTKETAEATDETAAATEEIPVSSGENPISSGENAATSDETPAATDETALSDEDSRFLLRVVETVNALLPTGECNIPRIAEELGTSASTLRRRVTRATGENPGDFVRAIQMERAVALLSQPDGVPILQVAALCGFTEASAFTTSFKRIYGCTPKQFRKQNS